MMTLPPESVRAANRMRYAAGTCGVCGAESISLRGGRCWWCRVSVLPQSPAVRWGEYLGWQPDSEGDDGEGNDDAEGA